MTRDADIAFCCVADERYFLGAVGLVNSLRLVGHDEPILLLDCGLRPEQREALATEATITPAPADVPPWLLKAVIPLSRGPAVSVLVDSDIIVTRSLAPLLDRADDGRIVAFRDRQQRFFGEWGELTGAGPAQRRPYVSSSLVIAGGEPGRRTLELLDELRSRVDFELTLWRRNVRDYPFLYADQDLLNAILATRIDPARVDALEQRLAATPPFRGLRVVDPASLRCRYRDGAEPYAVHQYMRKPWLEPTFDGVYSQLLRRLLTADDVAVRVPGEWLPERLRADRAGRLERARINARDFLRWHFGDRLPRPIAVRLEDRRHRREAWR
jgi:hypothetical protein